MTSAVSKKVALLVVFMFYENIYMPVDNYIPCFVSQVSVSYNE